MGRHEVCPYMVQNLFYRGNDSMIYPFTEQQEKNILGKWGYDFLRILRYTLKVLPEKWALYDLEFGEYYSCNAIFFCRSEKYGDCVLKINRDGDEALDDYNALREHSGDHHIRAFEYEDGAVLVERAIPGEKLSAEPSLEKRLAAFSELFNGRHIAPKNPQLFDTYAIWFDFCMNCVESRREDFEELYAHAVKAREIYAKMASVYDRKLLIHLDLCSLNIVSCGNGRYKIVDPYRTVIGDPVIETGRFIHYEKDQNSEKTEGILDYLEKSLNIPNEILRQCFYLDTVIIACENTQWGSMGGAGRIDGIRFAEKLMNEINRGIS